MIGSEFVRYVDLDTGLLTRLFNTCVDQKRNFASTHGKFKEREGTLNGNSGKRSEDGNEEVEKKRAVTKRRARGVARCTVNGVVLEGAGNHHHHRRSHQQGPDESSDRWYRRNDGRTQGRLLRCRAPAGQIS